MATAVKQNGTSKVQNVTVKKDVQQQLVTESDVLNYNNLVVRNSRRQVYATSVDVLQEYNSEEF